MPAHAPLTMTEAAKLQVQLGTSGVKRMGAQVPEEFLLELRGPQGRAKYREMTLNDATIKRGLRAIKWQLLKTEWRVEGGERTEARDRSGELGFANKRSAAWWAMRELLDPAADSVIALPPDDLLTGDLTAPHWRVMSGGHIQVEGKDEIRKRLGRSTDDGDAVVMAFWRKPAEAEVWGFLA